MVVSLVEMAYKNLEQREKYEKKYGYGSYERSELKKYLNKGKVKVHGRVVSGDGRMFTLEDVLVVSTRIDHINIFVSEEDSSHCLLEDALFCRCYVEFYADVQRYYSKGRLTCGLRNIRRVSVKRLKSPRLAYKLPRFKGEVGSIHKGIFFDGSDFTSCTKLVKGVSNKTARVVVDTVNTSLQLKYNSKAHFEKLVEKRYKSSNPFISFLYMQLVAKYQSFVSRNLVFNRYRKCISALDGYERVVNKSIRNVDNLVEMWSRGYEFSVLSASSRGYFGSPLVLKRSDGEYLVVNPYIYSSKSPWWSLNGLSSILSLYGVSSREGSKVLMYNPIKNRVFAI